MFGGSSYCCEAHRLKDKERMKELAIQRLRPPSGFPRSEAADSSETGKVEITRPGLEIA
jgi:hypothetical protein